MRRRGGSLWERSRRGGVPVPVWRAVLFGCEGLSGAAAPFARELGPCPVLYAYFEEHGLRLSGDAVGELGGALHHRRK